jgi:hypothetical protein
MADLREIPFFAKIDFIVEELYGEFKAGEFMGV